MPITPPDRFPENDEELDVALGKVYLQGKQDGKKELRREILDHLQTKFFGSKGNNRRADPENPRTAAILAFWEELKQKFEDGTL